LRGSGPEVRDHEPLSPPGLPGRTVAEVLPDGTFQIEPVPPGEYVVSVLNIHPALYLKDARFGATDVVDRPLRLTGRESSTLTIVLGSTSGAVAGTVTGRQGPAAGAQVVLVPDRSRHRADLFRAVTTNQHGRFDITHLVPGDYKVFAWEAIEPYTWFDPEVLEREESSARSVRVLESSSHTIALRAIAPR
jgi:hypothetical protein